MRPHQHPTNTRVLGQPKGWNADGEGPECNPLPVTECETFGIATEISFWKPTQEEIAGILAGKSVRLHVAGRHPPVAMDVEP